MWDQVLGKWRLTSIGVSQLAKKLFVDVEHRCRRALLYQDFPDFVNLESG